jgi:hypothetical protein
MNLSHAIASESGCHTRFQRICAIATLSVISLGLAFPGSTNGQTSADSANLSPGRRGAAKVALPGSMDELGKAIVQVCLAELSTHADEASIEAAEVGRLVAWESLEGQQRP